MAILESQLSTWSNHDAQATSKRTHEAIRKVLDANQWPAGMIHDFYLQGSYRNDTNIRGDSDVDVVLQLTSSFHHEADSFWSTKGTAFPHHSNRLPTTETISGARRLKPLRPASEKVK